MPEEKNSLETGKVISRRDFLIAGFFTGSVVALNVYLHTKTGRRFIANLLEGNFGRNPNIEIDENSQEILHYFNETIEKGKGLSPIEQEATKELEKRRDIIFAAAEKDWFKLIIKQDTKGRAITNIFHSPSRQETTVEILLPNKLASPSEEVKCLSHEFAHVFQYIVALDKFGYNSQEMDEYVNSFHTGGENEMDAWIFDNLSSFLYSKTHPGEELYGILLDPQQTGIDELGFTGYWLGRKKEFPQKLTDDLEFKWFLERYGALTDVGIDILTGQDGAPLFPLTVRDSEVSGGFINDVKSFFVPCGWSEAIDLRMDPTENNPLILRYFGVNEK